MAFNKIDRNIEELELKLQEAKQMQQSLNRVQQMPQPITQSMPRQPQQMQQIPQNQMVQNNVLSAEQIEQEKKILNKFMELNYGETVESFDKKLAAFKEAWLIENDPKKVSKSMVDEQLKLLRKSYKKEEDKKGDN